MWFSLTAVYFYVFILILINLFSSISYAEVYTFTSNGKTYQIVDQKKTWSDAAQYAANNGGYLVVINNATEQSTIYSNIQSKVPTTYT